MFEAVVSFLYWCVRVCSFVFRKCAKCNFFLPFSLFVLFSSVNPYLFFSVFEQLVMRARPPRFSLLVFFFQSFLTTTLISLHIRLHVLTRTHIVHAYWMERGLIVALSYFCSLVYYSSNWRMGR